MEPLGVQLYQGETKSSLHLLRQLLLPWLRWSKTAGSIVPTSPPSGYQGPQGFVWGSTLFNLLLKSVLIFITAFCMKAVQTVGLGTVIMWQYWILHENLWRKRKFRVLLLIQITLDYTQEQILLSCLSHSFHALHFSAKIKGSSERFLWFETYYFPWMYLSIFIKYILLRLKFTSVKDNYAQNGTISSYEIYLKNCCIFIVWSQVNFVFWLTQKPYITSW